MFVTANHMRQSGWRHFSATSSNRCIWSLHCTFSSQANSLEIEACASLLDSNPTYMRKHYFEEVGFGTTKARTSIQQPPKLELKQLPSHLRYAYLGEPSTLPVIISNSISDVEEERLLQVHRDNKTAIGWSITGIKGSSSSYCKHKIHMEENIRPSVDGQRRLNPYMNEVVRAEVLKLLDALHQTAHGSVQYRLCQKRR